MRIIPEPSKWSPYPEGRVVEACRDIERDASFFMGEDPPLSWEDLKNASFIPRGRVGEYSYEIVRDDAITDRMPVAPFVMLAKGEHVDEDTLYRAAGVVTASGRVLKDRYGVLEMGLANTEAVRVSEPYVEMTIHDLPSDGVPIAIGSDESTTPKSAPRNSVLVFTESAHDLGMRW